MRPIPTADEIAGWPAPNYENPQTRRPLVFGAGITTMAIVLLFVIVRFHSRTVFVKALGADDWVMFVAAVMTIGTVTLSCISTYMYMGYHIWDLPPHAIANTETALKISMAVRVIFFIVTALTKSSILLSYLRLFQDRRTKWFCSMMMLFTALWAVAFLFISLLECKPLEASWKVTRFTDAECLPADMLSYIPLSISYGSDVVIFLWPAQYLMKINIDPKQRIILNVMFSLGICVCGVGVCVLWYLRVLWSSSDKTWNSATLYAVVTIDNGVAIVCGCIPGCKPLLTKLLPTVFAPTHPSPLPITYDKPLRSFPLAVSLQMPNKVARPEACFLKYTAKEK